jgi:hypothetical protein
LNGAVAVVSAEEPSGSVMVCLASTWALPPVWSAASVIAPVVLLIVVPAAIVASSPAMENVTFDAFAGAFAAENDSPAAGGTVTRS